MMISPEYYCEEYLCGKWRPAGKRIPGCSSSAGDPGARFAICNAGGGFAFVGAMHDSFPPALELSKRRIEAIKANGTDAEIEERMAGRERRRTGIDRRS